MPRRRRFSARRRVNRPFISKTFNRNRPFVRQPTVAKIRRAMAAIPRGGRSLAPGTMFAGRNSEIVTLTFVYRYSTSIPALQVPTQVFRMNLNNLFDPGLGTRQPAGFDQLAAIWNNYMVTSVKITTNAARKAETSVNSNRVRLLLIPSSGLSVVPDASSAYMEAKGAITQWLRPDGQEKRLNVHYKMTSLFGVAELEQGVHGAATNAEPASENFVTLTAFNYASGVVTALIEGIARVEYKVLFSGRKILIDA